MTLNFWIFKFQSFIAYHSAFFKTAFLSMVPVNSTVFWAVIPGSRYFVVNNEATGQGNNKAERERDFECLVYLLCRLKYVGIEV